MVSRRIKWSKLALIITLVGLFCFVFTGAAMAVTNTLDVYADGNRYAYTGCTDSYTFQINEIDAIAADCFNNPDGTNIIIQYKKDTAPANFLIYSGLSLPVKFFCDGVWYFAQPTVITTGIGNATLHLPDLQIPDAEGKYVTKVFIGDSEQNLTVTNPCAAGKYCVAVTLDTLYVDMTFIREFTVKSSPASIIVSNSSPIQACGACITFTGTVYDCNSSGVKNELVTVKTGGVIKTGLTNDAGKFTITVSGLNLEPGRYTAVISVPNYCDSNNPVQAGSLFEVLKNDPTGIIIEVDSFDDAWGELRYNKCNDVKICVVDGCGYPAAFDNDKKVYFSALTPGNPPVVAGHFYRECPTMKGDLVVETGQQIDWLLLPAGQSCIDVKLIPLVIGPVTIEASMGSIRNSIIVNSIAPTVISKFEITPLVTDENGFPRAGWPLAVKVMLDRSASVDMDVAFTSDQGGITFDDTMFRAFGCTGDNDAIFPFCTDKQYYSLYTDQSVIGKTLTISVNVDGIAAGPVAVGPFVSPVEMQRTFKPNAWNVFSTPKWLADDCKESPEYARFFELLPFDPIVITYNNWGWQFVPGWKEVDPLRGYYVLAPQIEEWETENTTVDFIFARATQPDYANPPNGLCYEDTTPGWWDAGIGSGWRTVGVAVSPEIEKTLARQSDTAGQAFGSLRSRLGSGGNTLVWNPGIKLGNVNSEWTTISLSENSFEGYLYDPFASVYNGDLYWVFGGTLQNYSANIGLDMIQWNGGTRNGNSQP